MRRLPAEFERQSFIQVIFPHAKSDWAEYLEEAEANFVAIINAITTYQDCLVICHDIAYVKNKLITSSHLHLVQADTNDTWARDCSAISIYEDNKARLLDFTFTAWGGKFASDLDNQLSQHISRHYDVPMQDIDFILEGGAIESNAKGTLLITDECVFNVNRNAHSKEEAIEFLKKTLGVTKVLSLKHGYLRGDDTDSHIDTLARFISEDTIMYIKCEDKEDEHYEALLKMEAELKAFTDQEGKAYKLISLPFTKAIYDEDERLPATYANFLIINDAVLVPTYNDENDNKALEVFTQAFPTRKIIGIDCSILIRQHGSLHCVTMQFPYKVSLKK